MSQAKVAIDVGSENERLFLQLEGLLELQIQLVQRGDFSAVAVAGQKADVIVSKIASAKLLRQEKHKHQRLHLEKLYRKLSIIIGVEENCTAEQLLRVRTWNRSLSAYKNNSV